MLERFELADALELRPRDLTPPRRLRAEVARALITEPKLLLVDDRNADEGLLRLVRDTFAARYSAPPASSISATVRPIAWRCWRAAGWWATGRPAK
jgi:ABC-type uncharacterized transport system YnjBCD ATPase subunit